MNRIFKAMRRFSTASQEPLNPIGFGYFLRKFRQWGGALYSVRHTIGNVSLWLVVGSLAIESRWRSKDLNAQMERFQVKESKLLREIQELQAMDVADKPESTSKRSSMPDIESKSNGAYGIY